MSTFSCDHAKPFLSCLFPPMFIFFIMPRQVVTDDSELEYRETESCGVPRLDKFHRVGVHVDSCRQLSAYAQTQKCSCQGMISVEYV